MSTHHNPTPHAATITFLIALRRRLFIYLASVGIVFAGFLWASKKWYPFKPALVASLLVTAPILLYQLWAFIAPTLYRTERRQVWFLLVYSSILFYLGVAFAYFVVSPQLFFAFGLAFEVPVAVILCVSSGAVRLQKLKQRRPYIIVGALIISQLIMPPDVITQLLFAIPLWLLFELGVILAPRLIAP